MTQPLGKRLFRGWNMDDFGLTGGVEKKLSNLQVYFWIFGVAPWLQLKKKLFQYLWFVLMLFHDVGLHMCICILQSHLSEAGVRQVIKCWSTFSLNIACIRENRVQATRLLLAGDGKIFTPEIICSIVSDKSQGRFMLIEPVGIRQQARILKPSESLFSPLKKWRNRKFEVGFLSFWLTAVAYSLHWPLWPILSVLTNDLEMKFSHLLWLIPCSSHAPFKLLHKWEEETCNDFIPKNRGWKIALEGWDWFLTGSVCSKHHSHLVT